MDWKEIGPYRDFLIWVRQLRGGRWTAAVTCLSQQPASRAISTLPLDEMVLPEGFESEAAAIEAAKRHVNREHQRRTQPTG